jgi:hypothetical protein
MILVTIFGMIGIEHWLATFGKTETARLALGRVGIALALCRGGGRRHRLPVRLRRIAEHQVRRRRASSAGSAATIVIAVGGRHPSAGDRRPGASRPVDCCPTSIRQR